MCKINTRVDRTFSDHEACGIVDINIHVGSMMTVSCLVNIFMLQVHVQCICRDNAKTWPIISILFSYK